MYAFSTSHMQNNNALTTDLYQLTMAAAYFDNRMKDKTATFEMFVRDLPKNREYLVTAGLEQVVDYLMNLRFEKEDIEFLQALPQFAHTSKEFWKYLADFKFTGELRAVPEGTLVFAKEPILTITAPIIEAQLVETYILATINFQTMIATKAARIKEAVQDKQFFDFGMRRAHGTDAGIYAARAAYIGGADGTSCVVAGKKFGIPIKGTMAHSWVMANETEEKACEKYATVFPDSTVALIDTYDALKGTEKAIKTLGDKLKGVRIDSGTLDEIVETTKQMRQMLDNAGLRETKIIASGDLNEDKIKYLEQRNAPINAYGVGTELVTSKDAPALGGVYKLVEIDGQPRMKHSNGKTTLPGKKQVFRIYDYLGMGNSNFKKDVIGLYYEHFGSTARLLIKELLKPIVIEGRIVEESKQFFDTQHAKYHAADQNYAYVTELFEGVTISQQLQKLTDKCREVPK